ncbi:MAG: carbohydrate kinase [Erysipelotrichales bacterium]|nr:carbohydrate kinase [Erysipelotrichales bacterium]MBQ1386859.1 carbohydrate kinase [Erysipelotrichales bacterium]MBQ2478363.1 carbohydrate kinase [Erysipelotrichales bacterium]
MNQTIDVTALGELLIDFIENGVSAQGNPVYEANPGGAPCNVLAMLGKLHHPAAFIGKIGNDGFGRQLTKAIESAGILLEGVRYDDEVHTTLALVHKLPNGDRDFSFYRNPGADMNLRKEELNEDLIRRAKVFHYGTLSLTDEPVRSATRRAVEIAEEAGCVRSFDPNLRPPLWKDLEEAKRQFDYGFRHCDVLKISDNEIQWFTGKEDFDEGIEILRKTYGIPLICLSMGPDGSRAYYRDLKIDVPAFLQEKTIETTGAGDTFGACVIDGVLRYGLDNLDEKKLREILTFANAAASIVTTRKGALAVMPEKEEVLRFIEASGRSL